MSRRPGPLERSDTLAAFLMTSSESRAVSNSSIHNALEGCRCRRKIVLPEYIPRYPRVITTLQRWGNSQGIRIPKTFLQTLGMEVGTELTLELADDNSTLIIKPAKDRRPVRGRHRIEDLVAASAPNAFEGEFDWGRPQGKEVW